MCIFISLHLHYIKNFVTQILQLGSTLKYSWFLDAFILFLRNTKISSWILADIELNWALVVMAWRRIHLFHHHLAHNYTQAKCSVSLPATLPHTLIIFCSPPPLCALLLFLPLLFLSDVRCLVPPLGWSTDAGWRHSGLILLLLMLMLKEAIGTCYFSPCPISPGASKEVLIDRVIRCCMVIHRGFIGGTRRLCSNINEKRELLSIQLLCNSTMLTKQRHKPKKNLMVQPKI